MPKIKYRIYVGTLLAFAAILYGVFVYEKDYEKVYAAGEYYIQDNSTGGDCTSIGAWNDYTNTCKLTQNLTITSSGITEGINIQMSDFTLDCDGRSITASGTTATVGILAFSRSNVTIKNCTVSGFSAAQIQVQTGSSNCAVVNNIVNGGNYGIRVHNTTNTYVVGNSVSNTNVAGIYLESGSSNNYIYDNTVDSNNADGITLTGSAVGNEIIGNTVSSNDDHGINLGSSVQDSEIRGNTIQGNGADGTGSGIYFPSTSTGNTLYSNIVTGNDTLGDYDMEGGSAGVSGDNNTCSSISSYQDTGETGTCTWASALSITTCDQATIDKNAILSNDLSSCSGDGIDLDTTGDILIDCDDYSISGSDDFVGVDNFGGTYPNVIIKNCDISSFQTGIRFGLNNANGYIINNTADSNVGNGIVIGDSGFTITGNTSSNNNTSGFSGIYLSGDSDSSNILYNTLTNNYHGIRAVSGADSLTIQGNTISDNDNRNITFNSVTSTDILKNSITNDGVTSGTIGIELVGTSTGNVITSNIITDHTDKGVYFNATSTGNDLGGSTANLGNMIINNATDISDADSNDGTANDDNNMCNVVSNWIDFGEVSACTLDSCGNGTVEIIEGCDDGGTTGSDGCSATCAVESGYACVGEPSSCQLTSGLTTSAGIQNAAPSFVGGPAEKWTNSVGNTWFAQTSPISNILRSVSFADSNIGWAVSANSEIINTTNGGDSWTNSSVTGQFWDIFCLDINTCWAVGNAGKVVKTTDGGTTWPAQTSNTSNDFHSVYFSDSTNGWAVTNQNTIHNSTDGGATWGLQYTGSQPLWGVYFADSQKGWAVGNTGTILSTVNGGTAWSAQTSGTSNQLMGVYIDADASCQSGVSNCEGWAVGASGTIRYTANGGTNWTGQTGAPIQTLIDVHFIDANNGWVVGSIGAIASTTNGGTNWTDQSTGSSTLWGLHAIDVNNIWAVGDASVILKTGFQTNSSSTNPTHAGTTLYFNATANDANTDQYYLLVCDGNNTPTAGTPPACNVSDTEWAVSSSAVNSDSEATASYTTSSSDAETNVWYAFVCDASTCSSASQSSGNSGSPFVVNHAPTLVSGVEEVDFAAATELTTDGDMETGGTGAWTPNANPTLTKETTNPHGGSQVLRVARIDTSNPSAQQSILTLEKTYRATGWVRSDGNATPLFYMGEAGFLFKGSTSTEWQYFDVTARANNRTTIILLTSSTTGTEYTEWDDIMVAEVGAEPNDRLTFNFETDDQNGDDVTAVVCNANGFNDTTQVCTDGASTEFCRTTMTGGSQWTSQRSATFGLNDIDCTDDQNCWAVGFGATILDTTNGGTAWSSQTSGANVIYGVDFVDSTNGWAVGSGVSTGGANSNIRYYNGTVWAGQTSNTSNSLNDVSCVDTSNCWAVGASGTIVNTSNGGTTWATQTSNTTNYINAVQFVDSTNGWAVGVGISGGGNTSNIRVTSNGGTTWTGQTSGVSSELRGISFLDANTGWVVGNGGNILKTTNGGTDWSIQFVIPGNPILYDVYFANENEGWVTGSSGLILKTTDGGTIWSSLTSGSTVSLQSVHFVDNDIGWAVGNSETILKTTTGGVTKGSCDESLTHTVYPYIDTPQPHDVDGTFTNSPTDNRYTVHLFDAHDFVDDGSSENQFILVVDTPPTVGTFTTNNPAPPAGGSDAADFSVIVFDDNGDNDITTVEGYLFDDDTVTISGGACTETENDCYKDVSCTITNQGSGTDNQLTASCQVDVWFNANAGGNWEVRVNPSDEQGIVTTEGGSNANVTVPILLGVDLVESSIAYGTISVGGTTGSQSLSIGNVGNQIMDLLLEGTQMTSGGDNIAVGQQKWHHDDPAFDWTDPATGAGPYALVGTAGGTGDATGCLNRSIIVRTDHTNENEVGSGGTNELIHWKLRIPDTQAAGTYTGANTFAATANSTCSTGASY